MNPTEPEEASTRTFTSLVKKAPYIASLLIVLIFALNYEPGDNVRLSSQQAAVAATGAPTLPIAGLLKRSDTPLSPRLPNSSPTVLSTWLSTAQSFNANRLLWVYTDGADSFSQQARTSGYSVQCTHQYWVPNNDPNKNAMACAGETGTLLTPNYSSTEWRNYQLAYVKKQIDNGCRNFQQDNLLHSCNTQAQVTAYYSWLHGAMQTYAQSIDPNARILFSGNITNNQFKTGDYAWLRPYVDFLVSEIYATRAEGAATIRSMATKLKAFGAVNAVTIASNDVWLNQKLIASGYALGLAVIAPWDVYIGGTNPRFYGNPAHFAALYGMVRANTGLFDDYVSLADYYGTYSSAIPAQGTVIAVDATTYTDKMLVTWSRQSGFKNITKGATVYVGNTKYAVAQTTTVGNLYLPKGLTVVVGDAVHIGELPYLVSIRKHATKPDVKAVHLINWRTTPTILFAYLKRSDFPVPPTHLVTPTQSATPISYEIKGAYYVYSLGTVTDWAALFSPNGTTTSSTPDPFPFANYTILENSTGVFSSVIPAQGTVIAVDATTYTGRVTVQWTRQRESGFATIAKDTSVMVSNKPYTTIVASTVGNLYLSPGSNIVVGDPVSIHSMKNVSVSVRGNTINTVRKAVNIVSSSPIILDAYLKKSNFPIPPTMMVTPEKSAVPITYETVGNYYVYPLGIVETSALLY